MNRVKVPVLFLIASVNEIPILLCNSFHLLAIIAKTDNFPRFQCLCLGIKLKDLRN